jgi:O2-independent ubiquinone biosynthesis accessory factor UbiT
MHGHLPPGLARLARVMPLLPLELVAQRLIANALAARPSLFTRLGPHADATFAIDPVDCPFVFLIMPRTGSLRLQRELSECRYAARIAAPLIVLLGMLDGTYDGDALFFSRDLVIEGDTEAVLALRNAIEDAELDPATALGLPASLSTPVNRVADLALEQMRRLLDAPAPSGLRAHRS